MGKTMLFGPALGAEWTWLAVVMGANVALSLFYYVRVCFVVILCQLCRNSLPPCPRDPGEFPCSTNKFSFTVCRNTLPKVQIATYALPKNLSHFFCAQSSGLCLFPPCSWSLLYGEAARLCDNRSLHRLFGYFSPFFRLFYDKSKKYIKARLYRTKRNKKTSPLLLDCHHNPAIGKVMWRSG